MVLSHQGFSPETPFNHPELVSGSLLIEILKQVRNDIYYIILIFTPIIVYVISYVIIILLKRGSGMPHFFINSNQKTDNKNHCFAIKKIINISPELCVQDVVKNFF